MEYQINVSENHKEKIKKGYKNKVPITIQLSYEQLLNGKDRILLSERQINKIEKSKKENKGCRLTLTYDQLKKNHTGGFLPLLFAGLGALGSLIAGGAAIVKSVNDNKNQQKELDELKRHNHAIETKGKGLKKKKFKTIN